MAFQFANIVTIQIELGCIHGQLGWEVSEVGAGALGDVLGPGVVMETVAVPGAAHLAVTSVVIAAVTQSKAVSAVGAEKVQRIGVHQGSKGLVQGVGQLTVDALEVGNVRKILQSILLVDCLQPNHFTVAFYRVSSEKEFR